MKKFLTIFNSVSSKDGFVLMMCMLALVLLSLVGIVSYITTMSETILSGNVRSYASAFYRAEAAIREIVLGLANTPDIDLINNSKIVLPTSDELNAINGLQASAITPQVVLQARLNVVNNVDSQLTAIEPMFNCGTLVIHGGPASGSSMSIGSSHTTLSKHRFFVFVRNRASNMSGRGILIEVGYLRKLRP